MLKTCSISQARRSLADLIHAVEDGQEVELTRRGTPVARLVPSPTPRRAPHRSTPAPTPGQNGLWAAIEKFRAEADLEALNIEEILEDARAHRPSP